VRAVVLDRHGGPEVLTYTSVSDPCPGAEGRSLDSRFALGDIVAAERKLAAQDHFGKIVLDLDR
jgi:NADPH:quinone reductase-like Zn-dependent oxidoreductase